MGREDETGRCEDGYQGLVKQISGRVFKVGEGQATMEIAGARNDLRPSAMRKETSKQVAFQTFWMCCVCWSGFHDLARLSKLNGLVACYH